MDFSPAGGRMHRTRRLGLGTVLAAVLLSLVVGCGAPGDSARSALERRLQTTVDSLRATEGFPGATAAVVTPAGSVRSVATGYADREDSTRMTPSTRMLGGSTGKSFVAAVVLSLVAEGLVDLDTPVRRWLGEREWYDRLPNGDALTLRQLLRHQSGLIDHIHTEAFRRAIEQKMEAEGPDAVLTPEDVVGIVLDTEPLFPAGEGYHYSDTNYILVGLVVEAVTGRSYYDVLQRRFLEPLQLASTEPADQRRLPGLASGYIQGERPFGLPRKVATDGVLVYNPATEWTGGGLVTTSTDLARWAKALYEGAALSGNYLAPLLQGVPKGSTETARFGPGVRYGLAVTLRSTDLGPAYGHRGWTPGYLSMFEYYPEHEVAVAVQVNAIDGYDLSSHVVRIARAVVRAPSP